MTPSLTLPPIVERELRLASRRRATYWGRVASAFSAILVCFVLAIPLSRITATAGLILFRVLAIVAAMTSVVGVLQLSAEAFAREKREDTLGLLFLTPLRPVDLVTGKLVSSCLAGFYQVVAIVPLLALPILLGGVTARNYGLLLLGLVNGVFLAATLGLFVSARTWDEKRATSVATSILFLILVLPQAAYLLSSLITKGGRVDWLLALSPGYPIWQSTFARQSGLWWVAFLWTQLLGWLFFALACRTLPGCWQQRPMNLAPRAEHLTSAARALPREKPTRVGKIRRFDDHTRLAMLARSPVFWLAMRQRTNISSAVVIAGLSLIGPVGLVTAGRWAFLLSPLVALTSFFFINAALKSLVAARASSALVARDRADDPLEPLLSTPLTPQLLIEGHMLALRASFRPWVRAVLWVEAIWLTVTIAFDAMNGTDLLFTYLFAAAGVVGFLIPDLRALSWMGLWQGVVARNAREAEMQTSSLVIILPWLAVILLWISLGLMQLSAPRASLLPLMFCWVLASALTNYWATRWARRRLETRLKLWAKRRAAGELEHYDGWRSIGRRLGRLWASNFRR